MNNLTQANRSVYGVERIMIKQNKERNILIAEIIIVVLIILAILLPQLIGTVNTAQGSGEWKDYGDLNGKIIGISDDPGLREFADSIWDDYEIYSSADRDELAGLTEEGVTVAFLVYSEEKQDILDKYPQLTAYIDPKADALDLGESAESRSVSVIVKASNYAYLTSSRRLDEFKAAGTRIAGITGSELSEIPAEMYPDSEIVNYNNFADMFAALEAGKVDAVAAYTTFLDSVNENYEDIAYITTPLLKVFYGFGTAKTEKGDKLKAAFNSYLSEIKSSGELDRIIDKWSSMTEDGDAHLDSTFSGENGVLHVATTGIWFPMSYYSGNELTGRFIEIVNGFCRREGYTPVYECVDYPTEVLGLSTGNYDLMADTLYITPERLERLNITDPVTASAMFIVVREEPEIVTVSKASTFIDRLVNGFTVNFIREERWKMILDGLLTTLILALLSGVIGTVLGAVICRMRMSGNTAVTAFARVYVRAVQGIPILVLLMVLYYIVFTSDAMPAMYICVIGFSLDFAAYASEIFRSGIEAVPPGQARAAKALGFTPVRGFVKVVLPQALTHIIPVYSGQLVSMVKLTSVAGYISVLELTKVSDIIRSRTYDAFFPLMTSALIYFLLSNILTGLLKLAGNRLSTHSRSRKLKGVDTTGKPGSVSGKRSEQTAFAAGKELLVIEHLGKSFGDVTPLKDVNCTVKTGDVVSIIGPSGTGKSTLLNLINRLEEPDKGSVTFDGEDTLAVGYDFNSLRRRIGMVFQSFNLFSHLTIVENVMLAQTELLKRTKQEAYERSMELLETVGLAGKALSYPAELSGGQQQRIAIARTIAMDPEIILFDEPTSALDPTMVGEVLSVIRALAQNGATMLIVTHEMKFAHDVSNRVFYMDEGVIYEEGTPQQIFDSPQKEKTRIFIKRLKQLSFEITSTEPDFLGLISRIGEFGRDNMLSHVMIRNLQLAFEELVIQNIVGRDSVLPIRIDIEHSDTDGTECMSITYGGGKYDPFADGEELSVTI
ncbi:MAG: ABC transporter permease subunit, partial [Ruminiclostridium sp.]|nr:ABC transporter permease subunit [Ruminiclostridium sp.]